MESKEKRDIRITICLKKNVYEELKERAGLIKISTFINDFLEKNLKGGKK